MWDVDTGVVALRLQVPVHTQPCKCCECPSSKNVLLLNICQVFHCMSGCFKQIYFLDILLHPERSSDPAWLCDNCRLPGLFELSLLSCLNFPSGSLENAGGPTIMAPLLSCLCEGRATGGEQISRNGKGRSKHVSQGNSRDSGFSTERSCQPSWGGGSTRNYALGQFPLRGGHWDGSPACQLLKVRGRTGSCWRLKAKHQKFTVTWGTDTESLGNFSAVQVQEYNAREKKTPVVLPQQHHRGMT